MAGRQVFDLISQLVPFTQGLIISTLPRGSLHIMQPGKLSESMHKAYTREFHAQDRVTWQAIVRGQTLRGSDMWTPAEQEASPFIHGFLEPNGLKHMIAIPLAAPVLEGYPGAVVLFRGPDEADFTDAELAKVKNIGREIDEFISRSRPTRNTDLQVQTDPWTHNAPVRTLIFNKEGKLIFPKKELGLEPKVAEQVTQYAAKAGEHAKRAQVYADRLLLPDTRGDLWVFRSVVYRDFPALGEGPVVFINLQPEGFEWVSVRPSDVAADQEMTRLLPTLKFMKEEFATNPTLDEIAKHAHLSPFHFHRRFTDLMGQTPKHFLLSCQVHSAQRALAARRKELSEVATECGFAHQSHFTSRFKQATGLTPTRWRRMAADIVRSGGRK
jgi:AraC-like DNA-binding protein